LVQPVAASTGTSSRSTIKRAGFAIRSDQARSIALVAGRLTRMFAWRADRELVAAKRYSFGRVIRTIAFLSFDILITFPNYSFTLSLIMRA